MPSVLALPLLHVLNFYLDPNSPPTPVTCQPLLLYAPKLGIRPSTTGLVPRDVPHGHVAVVVRQLSRICGVIVNALHDEDLGCRKLSHVDGVAANLI